MGAPDVRKAEEDPTLFIFPRPVFYPFLPPAGFLLPEASWWHLPEYFSRRGKARLTQLGVLMGGGKGRAGRERGARQTREVGSGEKGGERGARGRRRPASWLPCLPGSSASHFVDRVPASWCVSWHSFTVVCYA